jgi:hypothetical protein
MTIGVPLGQPLDPARTLQAVIEQAWSLRRRRHRRIAAITAILATGLVAGIVGTSNGGPALPPLRLLPTAGAPFAAAVIAATRSGGVVGVTLRTRTTNDAPFDRSQVWVGSLDFSDHGLALAEPSVRGRHGGTRTGPEQVRELGSAIYLRAASCESPHCAHTGTPARPWIRPSEESLFTAGAEPQGAIELSTPFPLALLEAVRGSWRPGAESTIDDQVVRQYSATVSLADAELALLRTGSTHAPGERFAGTTTTEHPTSSAIPVRIRVWVDGAGRIRRLSASEPMFEARARGVLNIAQQFPAGSAARAPRSVPTAAIHQRGSVTTTESFDGYGSPSHRVRAPDAASVKAEPTTIELVG